LKLSQAQQIQRIIMFSNERPSPYGRQPYRQQYSQPPPRPFVQEDTLGSGQVQIERKTFHLALKENPRGRFLRITEHGGTKRTSIIVPATGLALFKEMLEQMVQAAGEPSHENEPEMMAPPAPEPPAPEPVSAKPISAKSVSAKPVRKTVSEAVRAKISAAAKARWAKIKGLKKKKA
jgi:hypothetical protein